MSIGEFPGDFESRNLSRDKLSREIGRKGRNNWEEEGEGEPEGKEGRQRPRGVCACIHIIDQYSIDTCIHTCIHIGVRVRCEWGMHRVLVGVRIE